MVVLDRQPDRVSWKSVEGVAEGEGPAPREKHTLTALSGGRLVLFGGAPGGRDRPFRGAWATGSTVPFPVPHTAAVMCHSLPESQEWRRYGVHLAGDNSSIAVQRSAEIIQPAC